MTNQNIEKIMAASINTIGNFSLSEVFLDIRPMLLKLIISRTKSNQVAQDITQDIFLKVNRMAKQFPTHDDARSYLIRIAINASIDHLRMDERRRQLMQGAVELFENYQNKNEHPEALLIAQEKVQQIDQALHTLPEKCRQALYLSRVEGFTHAEISEKLGISKSSVEKYIIRALLHCRDNIKIEN